MLLEKGTLDKLGCLMNHSFLAFRTLIFHISCDPRVTWHVVFQLPIETGNFGVQEQVLVIDGPREVETIHTPYPRKRNIQLAGVPAGRVQIDSGERLPLALMDCDRPRELDGELGVPADHRSFECCGDWIICAVFAGYGQIFGQPL